MAVARRAVTPTVLGMPLEHSPVGEAWTQLERAREDAEQAGKILAQARKLLRHCQEQARAARAAMVVAPSSIRAAFWREEATKEDEAEKAAIVRCNTCHRAAHQAAGVVLQAEEHWRSVRDEAGRHLRAMRVAVADAQVPENPPWRNVEAQRVAATAQVALAQLIGEAPAAALAQDPGARPSWLVAV